jgi:ABC-2 type transport system ATP-binding protein
VLSDAEALCNRVGILAGGRLVATGRIPDLQAYELRGWELIVSNVGPSSCERHSARARHVTRLDDGRYAFDLPAEPSPEALLRDLIAEGAHLVSLNPVRETLEDFFVKQVGSQSASRVDVPGGPES